jgi:uncharacterized BrkB/YihY/UPF0761 family membrane protein
MPALIGVVVFILLWLLWQNNSNRAMSAATREEHERRRNMALGWFLIMCGVGVFVAVLAGGTP